MDFRLPPARDCNKIRHEPNSVAFQNTDLYNLAMLQRDQNIDIVFFII